MYSKLIFNVQDQILNAGGLSQGMSAQCYMGGFCSCWLIDWLMEKIRLSSSRINSCQGTFGLWVREKLSVQTDFGVQPRPSSVMSNCPKYLDRWWERVIGRTSKINWSIFLSQWFLGGEVKDLGTSSLSVYHCPLFKDLNHPPVHLWGIRNASSVFFCCTSIDLRLFSIVQAGRHFASRIWVSGIKSFFLRNCLRFCRTIFEI